MEKKYSTEDHEIIVFYLNKGESVEMHTHDWDHELVCIMGEVVYSAKDTRIILNPDRKNHTMALKNIEHGFTANSYSIVLNLTKKDVRSIE
jgi:quercetin dioxygenase-like cupin family protein